MRKLDAKIKTYTENKIAGIIHKIRKRTDIKTINKSKCGNNEEYYGTES